MRYTETEIVKMLRQMHVGPEFPFDFQQSLLCFVDGVMQAVHNIVKNEGDASLVNFPDAFGRGYNAVIEHVQGFPV